MPSKRNRRKSKRSPRAVSRKVAQPIFFSVLLLSLVLWVMYRSLFSFETWFDESIGKALFFGVPVWVFVTITRFKAVPDTFGLSRLKQGLLIGLAVGGVYGFAATVARLFVGEQTVVSALLFSSNQFWWLFFLALLTAFWETLFFFSFVLKVIQEVYEYWSELGQIAVAAAIFVVFHIPYVVLYTSGIQILGQVLLLMLFAFGQGFLFTRRENGYALVISHAIWGMVLLTHVSAGI